MALLPTLSGYAPDATHVLAMGILSLCASVKRVDCHKSKWSSVKSVYFNVGAENARLENARMDWLWKADQA